MSRFQLSCVSFLPNGFTHAAFGFLLPGSRLTTGIWWCKCGQCSLQTHRPCGITASILILEQYNAHLQCQNTVDKYSHRNGSKCLLCFSIPSWRWTWWGCHAQKPGTQIFLVPPHNPRSEPQKEKKRQQTSGTSWKQIDSNLSHISLPSSVRRLTACTKQAAHNKLFFCHYLPNNNLCASMECKIQSKAPLQRLHIYIYICTIVIYIYIY